MATANSDTSPILASDQTGNPNEKTDESVPEETSKKVFDTKIEVVSTTKISFDIKQFENKNTLSEITSGKTDLLSHPICEAFLLAKWDSVSHWYYINGIFYFLFICNLTNLLYLSQFDIKGELKIKVIFTLISYFLTNSCRSLNVEF